MKTVQIARVKRIIGEGVDLVALVLTNGKPDIVRSPREFINDLKGSFLIDENVNSMRHPQVREVLADLQGATLTADLKYAKAGETWIVTENSQVMKNPQAKGFGKYQVGDAKEYEKDATIVQDGFLNLRLTAEVRQENKIANSYASARVSSADAFTIPSIGDSGSSPIADNAGEDPEFDEGGTQGAIPADVVKEATEA